MSQCVSSMAARMADIEAIHTFESTETNQTLVVGRDVTGVSACT